jgi:hypothetical protein
VPSAAEERHRTRVDVDRADAKLALAIGSSPSAAPTAIRRRPDRTGRHDDRGIHLVDERGLLPVGGRRAGLLAHAYQPLLVGLATRVFTGWLEVSDDGAARYAPHTEKGFSAPPRKNLLLVSNGLLAKYGLWQARRRGVAEHLRDLADGRAMA